MFHERQHEKYMLLQRFDQNQCHHFHKYDGMTVDQIDELVQMKQDIPKEKEKYHFSIMKYI